MAKTDKIDFVYHKDFIDTVNPGVNCVMSFDEVLAKDYDNEKAYKRNKYGFSTDILSSLVIEFDSWMQSLKLKNKNSMDCIFPIAFFDSSNNKFSSHRGLPIEFKLKCVSVPKQNDLKDKNVCTRNMLNSLCVLDSKSIFIFNDNLIKEALSNLSSWKSGSGKSDFKNFEFLTPLDLLNLINFNSQSSYNFIYNSNEIVNPIAEHILHSDYASANKHIQTWINKGYEYKKRKNAIESRNIFQLIINGIEVNIDSISDDIYKSLIHSQLKVAQNIIQKL